MVRVDWDNRKKRPSTLDFCGSPSVSECPLLAPLGDIFPDQAISAIRIHAKTMSATAVITGEGRINGREVNLKDCTFHNTIRLKDTV